MVIIAAIFIGIIIEAYSRKSRLKKLAETIFIRLEIISGRLAVSVMNSVVITNVSVVFLLNFKVSSMAMIIGVKISVALLLVNRAVTVVSSRII